MKSLWVAVTCLGIALCASLVVSQVAPSPMRNEDVVRMVIASRPSEAIVAEIRSRIVDFDLSDEMAQEMRLAGVSEEILRAMRARQAEMNPSPEQRPAAAAAPGGRIEIAMEPQGQDRALVFPDRLDTAFADSLQLGPAPEDRAVTGLAAFLVCRTADHVPDQWRSKSPLGRDFVSMPRHEMLDFRPGPDRQEGAHAATVELPLPVSLAANLRAGTLHDLSVGIAIRVGGKYLKLAEARKEVVLPEGGENRLRAVVRAPGRGKPGPISVEFVDAPTK